MSNSTTNVLTKADIFLEAVVGIKKNVDTHERGFARSA